MLHDRNLELTVEEKAKKQLTEKEAHNLQVSSSSGTSEKINDHGKVVIEHPQHPGTSSTFEALIRFAYMKRNLELMSSVVETQAQFLSLNQRGKGLKNHLHRSIHLHK